MPEHEIVVSARWEFEAKGCEIPVRSANTDFPDLKEHVARVNDLRFSDVALLEPARPVVQRNCLHSVTNVACGQKMSLASALLQYFARPGAIVGFLGDRFFRRLAGFGP
jgi:hypothetical protein